MDTGQGVMKGVCKFREKTQPAKEYGDFGREGRPIGLQDEKYCYEDFRNSCEHELVPVSTGKNRETTDYAQFEPQTICKCVLQKARHKVADRTNAGEPPTVGEKQHNEKQHRHSLLCEV